MKTENKPFPRWFIDGNDKYNPALLRKYSGENGVFIAPPITATTLPLSDAEKVLVELTQQEAEEILRGEKL